MDKAAETYPFDKCVTSQDWEGPYMDEDLIAAAYVAGGNFTKMAELLRRSRTGVYNASMSRSAVVDVLNEIKEMKLDAIEENQWNLAQVDKQAGQYMLDRQAKSRGYVSRQETSGPGGGPVATMDFTRSDNPIEDSKRYEKIMNGG